MVNQTRRDLPPPCRNCYQVADPVACENKDCKLWRAWFIAHWNELRKRAQKLVEMEAERSQGIPLGGRHYYHPDYLKRYFEKDPCKVCYLAQCRCEEPCGLRRNWENAKEEAGL